jgi:hypothetical protein
MEATKIENPSPFTYEELATCMKREAAIRRDVFPKRVADNKMTLEAAEQEILKMDAAADHFDGLANKPLVQYATAAQKEEITRLCNHPLVERREKTNVRLKLGRLDEDQATRLIAKMRKTIEDREGFSQAA